MTRRNLAAWTPPGLEPPFVSINETSPGIIELHVRAIRRPDQTHADQAYVVLTLSQFEGLMAEAAARLAGCDRFEEQT